MKSRPYLQPIQRRLQLAVRVINICRGSGRMIWGKITAAVCRATSVHLSTDLATRLRPECLRNTGKARSTSSLLSVLKKGPLVLFEEGGNASIRQPSRRQSILPVHTQCSKETSAPRRVCLYDFVRIFRESDDSKGTYKPRMTKGVIDSATFGSLNHFLKAR